MRSVAQEWGELLAPLQPQLIVPPVDEDASGANPIELVRQSALSAGIVEFLSEAAQSGQPLLILANDTHRFTDSASAVEALMEIAIAHHLDPRFRLLIATGSHTFRDPAERRAHEEKIIGRHRERFVETAWHDCFDENNLRSLAEGNAPRLHRWVVDARHILAIGSMEPHYFAGISGAHKTLTVGVMAYDDITRNHAAALSSEARGLHLEGNPIHEGLARVIAQMQAAGKRLFALNEIIAAGRLIRCYAGDPLRTLHEALPVLRERYAVVLPEPQDLIVAIVAPPLDRDLYQADKGIKNVENAVRDGGAILLDAACPHGIGIDRFHRLLQRAATPEEALRLIAEEGYTLGDHKAVRLRALTQTRRVKLAAFAPGLDPASAAECGLECFPTRGEAAAWALGLHTKAAETAALRTETAALRTTTPARHTLIVDDAGNRTLLLK